MARGGGRLIGGFGCRFRSLWRLFGWRLALRLRRGRKAALHVGLELQLFLLGHKERGLRGSVTFFSSVHRPRSSGEWPKGTGKPGSHVPRISPTILMESTSDSRSHTPMSEAVGHGASAGPTSMARTYVCTSSHPVLRKRGISLSSDTTASHSPAPMCSTRCFVTCFPTHAAFLRIHERVHAVLPCRRLYTASLMAATRRKDRPPTRMTLTSRRCPMHRRRCRRV